MYGRICDPGMGSYYPQMAMALQTLASQPPASGVKFSTPCGTISTRGATVFVPGLIEL